MITFNKFKEIFDQLDTNREPEILLEFKNESYMIVKHKDKITFGRCNSDIIYEFNDLEHLYSTDVAGFKLRDNWNRIEDILLDLTFSIIANKNINESRIDDEK